MILSEKGLGSLKKNHKLLYAIAGELGVHISTVYRWIDANDDNLTKASVLNLINKETGIPHSELLTEKIHA